MSSPPDFELWITDKANTNSRTLAGVVWIRDANGQYGPFKQGSLKLNPGIVISSELMATCYLTLKAPMSAAAKQAARTKGAKRVDEEPLNLDEVIK